MYVNHTIQTRSSNYKTKASSYQIIKELKCQGETSDCFVCFKNLFIYFGERAKGERETFFFFLIYLIQREIKRIQAGRAAEAERNRLPTEQRVQCGA